MKNKQKTNNVYIETESNSNLSSSSIYNQQTARKYIVKNY